MKITKEFFEYAFKCLFKCFVEYLILPFLILIVFPLWAISYFWECFQKEKIRKKKFSQEKP